MNTILAIDIGTTHCKAITFDEQGNALQSFKSSYTTISDEPGQSEQSPDNIVNSVVQLIRQSVSSNSDIRAISFSAAMHSVIAVDSMGKPLTNAIIWADTRSVKQAESLKQSETGTIIYNKTGTPIHPMSPLCKIIWLRETQPQLFAQVYKFISVKEYLFLVLFGKYLIDYSIASATGLFDSQQLQWCDEALEAAGIRKEQLSLPVDVTHCETNIHSQYKNEMLGNKTIPFVIGGNDGCLANLGSGAIAAGDAALTIGTSGAIRVTTDKIKPDSAQRVFTYLLTKDKFITGGAINNGGITAEWLSRQIMNDDTPKNPDLLLDLAETAPAGSGGLLFLPYLLGERAPMWDANARGILFGLNQQHTKAHIARAAIEGVCFAMRSVLEAIEETNEPVKQIFVSGGFTQSEFWVQTMANILGKQLIINNNTDASSTGAAIIAMMATGMMDDFSQSSSFFETTTRYTPQATTQARYNDLYAIFKAIYPKTKNELAAISRLQEKIE